MRISVSTFVVSPGTGNPLEQRWPHTSTLLPHRSMLQQRIRRAAIRTCMRYQSLRTIG
jgi:hypothetical protein